MKGKPPLQSLKVIPGKRSGLSLLEVIISTTVLAVSATMLLSIISTADSRASKADKRLMGQMICQNKLEEVQAGLIPLESSDLQPTAYYPDWQYKLAIEDWSSPETILDGRLVVVAIEAYYRPQEKSVNKRQRSSTVVERPSFTLRRLFRRPAVRMKEPAGTLGGR